MVIPTATSKDLFVEGWNGFQVHWQKTPSGKNVRLYVEGKGKHPDNYKATLGYTPYPTFSRYVAWRTPYPLKKGDREA